MNMMNRIARASLALAFPLAALADLSQTTTLQVNTNLNLDTGATASTGGDLRFSTTGLAPQGTAKAINLTALAGISGSTTFGSLDKSSLQGFSALASASPIATSALTNGAIIVVLTNGGNTSKLLVTAVATSSSVGLQFTTFGASGSGGGGGGGATTPSISKVLNNSSRIAAGFPNSGIAPSSLFVILGTNLSTTTDTSLHSSEGSGLGTSLNGASVKVTAAGKDYTPALYYAGPSGDSTNPVQIDGVMPASVPVGSATVTVTYNGTPSAPFQIQIVSAAPGITTYNGSAVATDATTGALLTYTKSGKPGEVIILWGTGLGSDPQDSDTTYTNSPHQVSNQYTIYVGGVQASVAYAGASVYPGVGVFGVTIPASAPTGCYVPIAAVTGSTVSNVVTIPIASDGGVCKDPALGLSGDQISTLSGQSTVKTGVLLVGQSTTPPFSGSGGPTTTSSAAGIFQSVTGATYVGGGGDTVSIGGCVVLQSTDSTGGNPGTTTGLDAGTITVTGPGGVVKTLTSLSSFAGFYSATLDSIPTTGGSFVFKGTGGTGVGPFTATVNFPNPLLTWTNQTAAATIARTGGLTVTWNGGASGSYVIISGSSSVGTVFGSYTCIAPQSAGSFTVPSYVLLTMPAGSGTTSVANSTTYSTFSATGIDSGLAIGSTSVEVNSTYN